MNPVIVYARMGSSRLPGKALMKIGEYQLLDLVCRRLKRQFEGRLVIATGWADINSPIRDYAKANDLCCISGDDENLVKRTLSVLTLTGGDYFIRVNADTPFVDADLLEYGEKFIGHSAMVTNISPRTFPYGVSLEIIKTSVYFELAERCEPEEKEHTTMHLYRLLPLRQIHSVVNKSYQKSDQMDRFVIDTENDLKRINQLVQNADPSVYKADGYAF